MAGARQLGRRPPPVLLVLLPLAVGLHERYADQGGHESRERDEPDDHVCDRRLGRFAQGDDQHRPDRSPLGSASVHYKRVIPCMDVDAGRVVKGTRFIDIRDAGDPVELAAFYDREGADELVFLDITATSDKRATVVELARRAADEVFVPFTIGGGVREVANVFGAQCVVLAIDAKRRGDGWEVHVAGGRTPTGRDAVAWAREGVERGAGEILLTSMDRDGTKDGYDLGLTGAIAAAVDVPVIASGGVGSPEHMVDGFAAGADAVLAASIFHYGRYSVGDVKARLAAAGVPVRR